MNNMLSKSATLLRLHVNNYFFVDRHAVKTCMAGRKSPLFNAFITHPANKFFCTETTLLDCLPEPPSNLLTVVNNKLSLEQKESALSLLKKIGERTPPGEYGLSAEEIDLFKGDLFVLFEAGYSLL